MIPDRGTCLNILKRKNPENIVNHTLAVTKVTMQIGEAYKKAGYDIDLKLLEAGALLHDVCKWDEIQSGERMHHARMGKEFVSKDFPELEGVVGKHYYEAGNEKDSKFWTLEEKIVNYEDKRVMHDKVVSLKKRIEDLKDRYKEYNNEISKGEALVYELEKDLFSKIDLKPEDIV